MMMMMEMREFDEAGTLVATYVESRDGDGSGSTSTRVDVLHPAGAATTRSWLRRSLNVFMPAGYPSSVTSDYLGYQIYDSLQAFSSAIAGLLANRAVLQGLPAPYAFHQNS